MRLWSPEKIRHLDKIVEELKDSKEDLVRSQQKGKELAALQEQLKHILDVEILEYKNAVSDFEGKQKLFIKTQEKFQKAEEERIHSPGQWPPAAAVRRTAPRGVCPGILGPFPRISAGKQPHPAGTPWAPGCGGWTSAR